MSRKKKHEHVNHERWLVSYADFITLLFAFFVVLFASSQSDKKKQAQLATAMKSAFSQMGIFDAHSKTPPLDPTAATQGSGNTPNPLAIPELAITTDGPASAEDTARVEDQFKIVRQQLGRMLEPQVADRSITVNDSIEGMVLSLKDAGFFDSGSAEVRPSALPVIRRIAQSLAHSPMALRIEGHTDDMPIHTTQFDSNWELSTARATAIARVFLAMQIQPARLSAAGYAEYHPIASNGTEAGRAQNRRVDIIVLQHPSTSR